MSEKLTWFGWINAGISLSILVMCIAVVLMDLTPSMDIINLFLFVLGFSILLSAFVIQVEFLISERRLRKSAKKRHESNNCRI